MKDRTSHEPWCLNLLRCMLPWQHLFVCHVPAVSIRFSAHRPSLSAPSGVYNPLPIAPFLFLSKKSDTYSLFPRCRASSIRTSVIHLVSHWSAEKSGQKKRVNIWTATKDGGGEAPLASASVMSRPETSSSHRWLPPHPIMANRENCPTIFMFVTRQRDRKCQPKMAARPNNVSSRLIKVLKRIKSANLIISHSFENQIYFPRLLFFAFKLIHKLNLSVFVTKLNSFVAAASYTSPGPVGWSHKSISFFMPFLFPDFLFFENGIYFFVCKRKSVNNDAVRWRLALIFELRQDGKTKRKRHREKRETSSLAISLQKK